RQLRAVASGTVPCRYIPRPASLAAGHFQHRPGAKGHADTEDTGTEGRGLFSRSEIGRTVPTSMPATPTAQPVLRAAGSSDPGPKRQRRGVPALALRASVALKP